MIEYAFEIFLFIVCVIFSAFFSSSEVALISMTRAKVRTLDNENRVGSHAIVALKESPEHLLTTILIGNNIVNIAAASIATAIAIKMFGDFGVGIATGFVVIILLVFGEIGPRSTQPGIGLPSPLPLPRLSFSFQNCLHRLSGLSNG